MTDRMLKFMLIATGIFNVADYISTMIAISNGVPEGNPVMDAVIGTPWFPVIKLVLVPLALYFVWRCRGRVRRVVYYAGVVFAAYGLLTAWHVYGQLL